MNQYKPVKILNQEPHSQVILAIDLKQSIPVILKQWSISASDLEGIDPFHEAQIMTEIETKCPNGYPKTLVSKLGLIEDGDTIALVLEYMQCDSIQTALLNDFELTQDQVASITYQMVQSLITLHSLSIIHRDVKPSNFLLNMVGEVKLSDFGISAIVPSMAEPTLDDMIGTLHYLPPEIALRQKYGAAVDVWSLGISVIEMLTGNTPLHTTPGLEVLDVLKDDSYNPLHHITIESYQKLSESSRDFISQCCQFDPAQRPTLQQLLQHPFISKNKGKKSPLYDICDKIGPLVKASHFSGL